MQGQANHFSRYAPERIEYGINRYVNEARRLYGVLDKHLQSSASDYLVGDKCTIADIAHWGWIYAGFWAGVDVGEFPALKAWSERMLARPGVAKGKEVPEKFTMVERYEQWKIDPKSIDEHAKKTSAWIMKGMAEDAKK